MDRSIDSIGSCSLDADSTDFSDTSESLFISPSSTREDFTAGITERCRKLQQPSPLTPKLILNQPINQRTTTTAYFDINSGKINTVVSRSGETNGRYFNGVTSESFLSTKTIELQSPTVVAHANKKPSYLNLACCVNGYSNYTNYVSIERKEINKSREVSPIRPVISTISMSRQQRSSDNLLSVPAPVTFVKQSPLTSITKRFASLNINDQDTTDNASMVNGNGAVSNRKSFIQQRVEKLYGTSQILTTVKTTESIQVNGNGTSHHYTNGSTAKLTNGKVDEKENDDVGLNSLPVMKHLRPEFCKQLQFMSSPKKSLTRTSTGNVLLKSEQISNGQQEFKSENSSTANVSNGNLTSVQNPPSKFAIEKPANKTKDISIDLTNSESVRNDSENLVNEVVITLERKELNGKETAETVCEAGSSKDKIDKMESQIKSTNGELKDGHYFLAILMTEKARILKMADETEKELLHLQSNPSTIPSEEILGVILAAIGKARLLATKKFKQFEGLCEENLKPKADGPPTLAGDLQGFWDMLLLQVDNINAAFNEIREIRENGWKKLEAPSPQPPKGSRLTKRPLTQSQTVKSKSNNVPIKKPSTATTNSDAAQRREEQRKKLLELKRKQKAAILNGDSENVALNGDTAEVTNGAGTENSESKKENGNVEIFL